MGKMSPRGLGGCLADQYLCRRDGVRFEPRGEIDRVADRRVFGPPFGADVADRRLAGVQADADRNLCQTLARQARPSARPAVFCIATAALTAFWASSGVAVGAPKSAIRPSPIYLSSVPPCSKMISVIAEKY